MSIHIFSFFKIKIYCYYFIFVKWENKIVERKKIWCNRGIVKPLTFPDKAIS